MSRSHTIGASTAVKAGRVLHYSNTSDDALGLSGAFADIGSALSQAKEAILIASWLLSPGLHLPFFHEQLRYALQAHKAGDLEDGAAALGAKTQYQNILTTFPVNSVEHVYAQYFLAVIDLQEGNTLDAIKRLDFCTQKQPNNPQFYSAKIVALHLSGELTLAKRMSEDYLSAHRFLVDDPTFLVVRGDVLLEVRDSNPYYDDEAISAYRKALQKNPGCVPAMRGLGQLYLKKGLLKEATQEFHRVLSFYPDDMIANLALAKVAYARQDFLSALGYVGNGIATLQNDAPAPLRTLYALAYCQSNPLPGDESIKRFSTVVNKALQKDPGNFELHYWNVLIQLKRREVDSAKDALKKCIEINPTLLREKLETVRSHWPSTVTEVASQAEESTDPLLFLNLDAHCVEFDKLSSSPFNKNGCLEFVAKFPLNRDGYFRLAECYGKEKDYDNAIKQYAMAAYAEASDVAYLKKVVARLEVLQCKENIAPDAKDEALACIQETRAFIKRLEGRLTFNDAYGRFREQLPTLGEMLVKKAVENPRMVVALQLWNRSSDPRYVERIQNEFKAISQKLYPDKGGKLPDNLLIRFTNTASVGYTHHQKYVVVDKGEEYPTVFYGGCDLAFQKFSWSEHPLFNTVDNQGARARAHNFNQAENDGCEMDARISSAWREVVSCVEGPVADDFVQAFADRWSAGDHATLKGAVLGVVGVQDQKQVATYVQSLQERRLPLDPLGDDLFDFPEGSDVAEAGDSRDDLDEMAQQVEQEEQGVEQEELDEQRIEQGEQKIGQQQEAEQGEQAQPTRTPYHWNAQVLQSTRASYAPQNPGFFRATKQACESSIQQAMISAIAEAKNYVYIETQYLTDAKILAALVKRIVEKDKAGEAFHVYNVLPFSPNGNPGGKVYVEPIRQLQWQLIQNSMRAIEEETGRPWSDYLSLLFFAQWEGVSEKLATLHTDGKPHTRAEQLDESHRLPVYIHSKFMVIDDEVVINGSANLNERSLSGEGDSEIAMIQHPQKGHEAVCRAEVSQFMKERILGPYFGSQTTDLLAPSGTGPVRHLGSADVVAHIQRVSTQNYDSYASDEPGHMSRSSTGKVVAFPFKTGQSGHVGELRSGCEMIPDAPRGAGGKSPPEWQWVAETKSKVLAFSQMVGYRGAH